MCASTPRGRSHCKTNCARLDWDAAQIIAGLGPSVAGAHALRAQAAAHEGRAEALGVRQIVSPRLTRQIGLRIRKGVDNEAAELVRAALQVAGDGLGLSAATA